MKKKIEDHLRDAIQEMVPDRAEEIWNRPVEKACGNEWYLDDVPIRKQHRKINVTMLSAVAACFAVCIALYCYQNIFVESIIYLDVNPSIELQTNRKQKIVKAEAHNDDGAQILNGMKLTHVDIEDALNVILDSVTEKGYLNKDKHMILLSVEGKNKKKTDEMCRKLEREADQYLQAHIGAGKVYAQQMQRDTQLEEEAKVHGISPGKAAFVRQLLKKYPQMKFEDLANKTLDELKEYLYPEEKEEFEDEEEEEEESPNQETQDWEEEEKSDERIQESEDEAAAEAYEESRSEEENTVEVVEEDHDEDADEEYEEYEEEDDEEE